MALAHGSNVITLKEINRCRIVHTRRSKELPYFNNIPLVPCQLRHHRDQLFKPTVFTAPEPATVEKFVSVDRIPERQGNAQAGQPLSQTVPSVQVQYLIPDFYESDRKLSHLTYFTCQRPLRLEDISEEMTQAVLSDENRPKKQFLVNQSFKDIILSIQSEIQDVPCQDFACISPQLTKIRNIYQQFLIDPRIVSEDIVLLLIQIVATFEQQRIKMLENDLKTIEELISTSLKLLYTIGQDKTTKYIFYIIRRFTSSVMFSKILLHACRTFDYVQKLVLQYFRTETRSRGPYHLPADLHTEFVAAGLGEFVAVGSPSEQIT